MHKPIRRSYLAVITAAALLPLLFNACGGPNGLYGLNEATSFSSTAQAQQKLCEAELLSNYSQTYHPLMKNNCNQCHSNAHGSNDVKLSYNAFRAKGQALIDYQAKTPHGGNAVNLTTQIAAVQQPWSDAVTAYNACLAANPDEDADAGVPLKLNDKPLAAINGSFKEYAWDLSVDSSDRPGEIRGTFRIEARQYTYQGSVVGFEFRNASLQLAAGQPAVQVDGIRFTVMGVLQDATTTYTTVSANVSGTAKTVLTMGLANAFVYTQPATATTPVGIQFIGLK